MALAKRAGWGHPVDNVGKAAATWSLCPELTLPTGVAGKVCDGSTCMVVCEPGKVAMGRRRIKCRWKRSKGFFWKQELPTCSGCDPDDPTTAIADSNMIAECAVNNLNKNKCTLKCSNGGTIFGRNKVKMTCKCPRINGVKTCGWTMFKSQLSSTAIAQLTCDGGTSTVTSAPTTVAGDSTAVVTGTGMTPSDGSTTVAGDTVASTAAAGSTASMESTASGDTTALGDSTSSAESAAPGDTTAMNASTAPGDTTAPGDSTAQAGSTGPSDTTAAPSAAETVTSAATNAAQTTSMLVTR